MNARVFILQLQIVLTLTNTLMFFVYPLIGESLDLFFLFLLVTSWWITIFHNPIAKEVWEKWRKK
jgi:uncharacterized membrane protein